MRPRDTPELFAQFEFPMSRARLVEEAGERRLDAPSGADETIAEVLERTNATTVHSLDDAHTLLLGNLSEAYVGRKQYDDRSPNPVLDDHVSF